MRVVIDWTEQGFSRTLETGETMILPRHVIEVTHDVLDEKGRLVGGRALILDCANERPADHRFELRLETTRDGEAFGALRPTACVGDDLDKAKQEALRRLERQGKSFRKRYGVAGSRQGP